VLYLLAVKEQQLSMGKGNDGQNAFSGALDRTIDIYDDGTYYVLVTNKYECKATDTINVVIEGDDRQWKLPGRVPQRPLVPVIGGCKGENRSMADRV